MKINYTEDEMRVIKQKFDDEIVEVIQVTPNYMRYNDIDALIAKAREMGIKLDLPDIERRLRKEYVENSSLLGFVDADARHAEFLDKYFPPENPEAAVYKVRYIGPCPPNAEDATTIACALRAFPYMRMYDVLKAGAALRYTKEGINRFKWLLPSQNFIVELCD